jgi:predicted NBD/HSP70 family sugar kinase
MGLARVFTDAHAGAFDFFATHRTAGRILALSLGTGVGACVLDDGELLRVSPLAADGVGGGVSSGHLGQMDVSPACPEPVPVGRDGGRGSLEAYLGAPALRERFGNDLHAALRTVNLDDPAIRALVRGLRIAHAIYRPNTIALLGGVGLGLSHLIAPIRAATADGLTSLARPNWRLVAGDTLFHAAIGAARLAAQSLPLG